MCILHNHNRGLILLCFILQKVVGFFYGGLHASSTLSVIFVVIYGAKLTISGSMTPGALTSFILYSLTGKEVNLSFVSLERVLHNFL